MSCLSKDPGTCHRCRVGSEAECQCPEPSPAIQRMVDRARREHDGWDGSRK